MPLRDKIVHPDIFIHTCVCGAYMCAYVCGWDALVHTGVCVEARGGISVLLSFSSILLFEAVSLTEPGVHHFS